MDAKRRFLEKVLASGLETGTVTTDDIVSHANAGVLASELPVPLKAKLITAALAAKTMDTKLIVDTLGTADLADNIPMRVLWACIAECAGRELGDSSAASKSGSKSAAAPASKPAEPAAPKRAPTSPVAVPKSIAGPKPNASAKAKGPENGDASKRAPATGSSKSSKSRAATGSSKSSKSSKSGAGAASRGGRSPTTPLVPRSEFEVDTDIGEDWGVDDIVEVVEESDVVSSDDTRLNDWRHDEDTATRDNETKR